MRQMLVLIGLRLRRNLLVMFGIATLATVFAGLWWETDQFDIGDAERGAYDNGLKKFTGNDKPFARWFGLGRVKKSTDIVIIGIDDASMSAMSEFPPWRARYGTVPYDRVLWADLLTYLDREGVRAVIFDSVMDQAKSDLLGDIAFGDAVAQHGTPLYVGFNVSPSAPALPVVPAPKNRFVHRNETASARQTVDAGAAPVVVAPAEDFPEEPTPEEAAKKLAEESAELRRRAAVAYAFPLTVKGLALPTFPPPPGMTAAEAEQFPEHPIPAIPQLLDVAAGFGVVAAESDEDGKLRQTYFAYTDGDHNYVTVPVAVAADAFGAEEVELSPGEIKFGRHVVPINKDGTAEIDYGGRLYDRFDTRSLVDVLRYSQGADAGAGFFKDKYVFIAGFSIGGGDTKATPLDQGTPGVVKQAATLQNLLDGRFILKAPTWVSYLFAFFVALFSVSLVLVVRNTFVDIGWPVLLYVGFFVVTGSFLVATKVHVLSALPGLAGTVASVLATTWERLFARKERERIKEMFRFYMEADLVELMVEQRKLPSLDGQNINITAFFSDIRGFSTFSERYRNDPRSLMKLLNKYLSTVTPIITQQGACIDKYIGDAVVALFGAPVEHLDHAIRACKAALEVQQAIGVLREEFGKQGLPDVYTRIGLNTDTMMVGNVGSAQLLDYTAIGDGMNLAARLEAANKDFGTLILMGPATFDAAREHVEAREVDWVRVAGKTRSVAVYELLAMKGHLPQNKRKVIDLYGQALLMYRQRQFADAMTKLDEAVQLDTTDGPSLRLRERCRALLAKPPPVEWDAVSDLSK